MSFRWLPIEGTSTYALYGIDAEKALNTLKDVSISVHCWQGDDVVGFDSREAASGGIQATGDYPGKANTPEELMADYDKAFSLIGGKKKLNLHACYAIFEDGEAAGRDEIEPKHFAKWVEFAKERGMGIDFNPTFFSHPMVKDGLTLSSPDKEVRKYWIKRGVTCLNFEKDNEERLTNIIFEHKYSKPSEELQCSIVTARRYR